MKKTKILFVLLAFLLSGLLSSCRPTDRNNDMPGKETSAMASVTPDLQSTPAPSPLPSPSQSLPPAPASGFVFKEKTFSNGRITVNYPQITDMPDSAAQEKLNKIIADTAMRDIKDLESGTTYELDYKVTLNSPSVISMYFTGYGDVPGAAHPYQFLRSVTIDTGKQKAVRLPDLVKIDASFVQLMLNGQYSAMGYDMTEEYRTSIRDYIAGLGDMFWLGELKDADMPGHDTSSYLTKEGLVLSFSVPHALGDHIEITLDYKTLAPYKTDSPLWKALED